MTDRMEAAMPVESPERIWIESEGGCPYFYHEDELSDVGSPVTEYVRADKLRAEIEALKAENEMLREALKDADNEQALAGAEEPVAWAEEAAEVSDEAWAGIRPRPATPQPQPKQRSVACECHRCIKENDLRDATGRLPLSLTKMILCPQCGNKRCPKASDHRLACTGSNDSGQPGSVYAEPQPQPKQEPVAWQWLDTATFRKKLPKNAERGAWNPLYRALQPQPDDTALLRQALEALECSDWYMGQLELIVYSHDDAEIHDARAKVQSTIAALRERIGEGAAMIYAKETSHE